MDVLCVSDKTTTGDRIDNRGGSFGKNGAIDYHRLGLNLQRKDSSFVRHEMEIYHHHHHQARNGDLGYYHPFTNAQLKELERQEMIYKYMMASIPIPINLLLSSQASNYDGLNVKFGLKVGDNEPGRCRRTDGKKWRCSKEVVPHYKYCERHLHRGRPRSRKPVETSAASSQLLTYSRRNNKSSNSNSDSEKKDGSFDPLAASMLYSYRGDPRSFNWKMVKGEVFRIAAPTEQQPNGRAASILTGNYDNFSYSATEQQGNQYLNFIDVWSNGVSIPDEQQASTPVYKTSVSANGNLPISWLDLSMGSNKSMDDEMDPVEMGLGVIGSCQDHGCCITPSGMSSWLAPAAATPGGPLAEILRPSSVATPAAEHPSSPIAGDGETHSLSVLTPSSSSSGVTKKTVASLSDNSSSSQS